MRPESINTIEPRTRRHRGMRLAACALLLASCAATVHYSVKLSDWRGSVEAAKRGVHGSNAEEQIHSVVVLHKAARDAVEGLRAAARSSNADVRRRAEDALRHITELTR